MTPPNYTAVTVEVVLVPERMDGVYVFRNSEDADAFADAVEAGGGEAIRSTETVCHTIEARELIRAERDEED